MSVQGTISEANNSWECQWNTLALTRHLQTRKAVFPARCEMIKVMIERGGVRDTYQSNGKRE